MCIHKGSSRHRSPCRCHPPLRHCCHCVYIVYFRFPTLSKLLSFRNSNVLRSGQLSLWWCSWSQQVPGWCSLSIKAIPSFTSCDSAFQMYYCLTHHLSHLHYDLQDVLAVFPSTTCWLYSTTTTVVSCPTSYLHRSAFNVDALRQLILSRLLTLTNTALRFK